ncbi:hypothetical protein CAP36_09785 [Chitinophagaceae bacterium IBVUCB2]|nr:hypothetical protein CAP36_09785 [Chitinophagaceae bacterium IBVUCB2]
MKELSKFYSSLGLLIILNIIIKPLWIFGIDRQVQNVVGTETYGVYFSLLNFTIVFSFLLDWGLTAFFNRQLAANRNSYIDNAGTFIIIKLFFSFLYAVIVFATAYFLGVKQWSILIAVILIQILTSLFIFFRSIVTAHQWFKTDAWLSIIDKLLMIFICGSFLLFPAVTGIITIHKFLWIQITCTALALLTVLTLINKKGVQLSFNSKALPNKNLIRVALPFGIIILLMSVHNRLDAFLLERLHPNGAYEAGIYAGAYRLLDAANMIGYLLASFLLPFIARQSGEDKKIDEVVLNSRHLLLIIAIFVSTTTIFLAPWIQQLLYHNSNADGIAVLKWCLPALIGYSLLQVYGTVLTANGQIVQFCYIVLLSVLLNIVLNLLLIPVHGAKGCAMTAIISQAFCGISTMLYVQKKAGIKMHLSSLLIYTSIAALLCGFYYLAGRTGVNEWMVLAGAVIVVLITTTILFKLINPNEWRSLIQQKNS